MAPKKITLSCLQKAAVAKEGVRLLDTYRLRLMKTSETPLFQDMSLKTDHMLVVDVWSQCNDENAMQIQSEEGSLTLGNLETTNVEKSIGYMQEDSIAALATGAPLNFSFISLEQLRKSSKDESGDNKLRKLIIGNIKIRNDPQQLEICKKKSFNLSVLDPSAFLREESDGKAFQFDCNPLTHDEAIKLNNSFLMQSEELKHILDQPLFSLPCWLACASPNVSIVFIGQNKHAQEMPYTANTTLLGYHTPRAFQQLDALSLKFQKFAAPRCTVYVAYDLLAPISPPSKDCYPARAILEMQWSSRETERPSAAINQGATGKLLLSPGCSDVHVEGFLGYVNLTRILNLTDALVRKDPSLVKWPGGKESRVTQRALERLLLQSRIRNATPLDSTALIYNPAAVNATAITTSSSDTNTVQDRDLDFTEQLWAVLSECSSLAEVITCLEQVFIAIQERQIKSMLRPGNKSTIARLIRAAAADELHLPTLEPLSTLLILLELGIDRFIVDLHEQMRLLPTIQFSDVQIYMDSLLKGGIPQLSSLKGIIGGGVAETAARALLLVPLFQSYVTLAELTKILAPNAYSPTSLLKLIMAKYAATFKSGSLNPCSYEFELKLKVIDLDPEYMKRHMPFKWTKEALYQPRAGPAFRTVAHFTAQKTLKFLENGEAGSNLGIFKTEQAESDESSENMWSGFLGTLTTLSYVPTDAAVSTAWSSY